MVSRVVTHPLLPVARFEGEGGGRGGEEWRAGGVGREGGGMAARRGYRCRGGLALAINLAIGRDMQGQLPCPHGLGPLCALR